MAGKFGNLTKDKFGFAIPVTDPPFDRPPYYYRDIELMFFAFETDENAAVSWVPEGLQLSDSPPVAFVIYTNYRFSTLGPYTETILGFNTIWEGEPRAYCSNLFVSNEVGMIAGREIYGFPKLLANITWKREHESIIAYTERPEGKRIVTSQMRCRDNLRPENFPLSKLISLKVIPGAEEGADFAVAQLVETDFQCKPVIGSDGRAELFSGPGNVTFDSPSEVDPWYRIPVKKMLQCVYGRFNCFLPAGRIIKDYLKK